MIEFIIGTVCYFAQPVTFNIYIFLKISQFNEFRTNCCYNVITTIVTQLILQLNIYNKNVRYVPSALDFPRHVGNSGGNGLNGNGSNEHKPRSVSQMGQQQQLSSSSGYGFNEMMMATSQQQQQQQHHGHDHHNTHIHHYH